MSIIQKAGEVFRQNCCSRWLHTRRKQYQSSKGSGKTNVENFGRYKKVLGIIGYYRKKNSNFSKTAEPLYIVLKKMEGQSNSSKSLISWGETQREALGQLLLFLVELPILVYQDHNKEFILHIVASGKGLESDLLQY